MSEEVLLIDGDIIRYRCAFSAEKTHYLVQTWHEDCSPALDVGYDEFDNAKDAKKYAEENAGLVWSRKEIQPVEFALQATKTTIEAILAKFPGYESTVIYLSGHRNFRDALAVTRKYKDNRPPKPKYYKEVGEYLVNSYGAKYTNGCEADDVIAMDARDIGDRAVIISTDKDLRQISGRHFNWVKSNEFRVSKREAAFNLWSQVLTGDRTDNVPGLDGIGTAGAAKILEGAKSGAELEERVRRAYRDNGKDDAYFEEQLQLIRLGIPNVSK